MKLIAESPAFNSRMISLESNVLEYGRSLLLWFLIPFRLFLLS